MFLKSKSFNFTTSKLKLAADLIIEHSLVIRTLSQSYLTVEDVVKTQAMIYSIQKRGLSIYAIKGDSSHDKEWITINSHYMNHTKLATFRSGVPRATAVFAFESELGFLKTWNANHKNGISEGSSMFKYIWTQGVVGMIIEADNFNRGEVYIPPTMDHFKKGKVVSIEIDLEEFEFYIIQECNITLRHIIAVRLLNFAYDKQLCFYCGSEIDEITHTIPFDDVVNTYDSFKVNNMYYMYNCYYYNAHINK